MAGSQEYREFMLDDAKQENLFEYSFRGNERKNSELGSTATIIKTVGKVFIVGTVDGCVYRILPDEDQPSPEPLYQHTDRQSVTEIHTDEMKNTIATKTSSGSIFLWSFDDETKLLEVSEPVLSMCFSNFDLFYGIGVGEGWVIRRWNSEDELVPINTEVRPVQMLVCQQRNIVSDGASSIQRILIVSDGAQIQRFDLDTNEAIFGIITIDNLIGLRKCDTGYSFMVITRDGFEKKQVSYRGGQPPVSQSGIQTFMEDTQFNYFALVTMEELQVYNDIGEILTKFPIRGEVTYFRVIDESHFAWLIKDQEVSILCIASKESVLKLGSQGSICDFMQKIDDSKVKNQWYCFKDDTRKKATIGLYHLTVPKETRLVQQVLEVLWKQVDGCIIMLIKTEESVSLHWYQESVKKMLADAPIASGEIGNLVALKPLEVFFTRDGELWKSSMAGEERKDDLIRCPDIEANIQMLASNGSNRMAVLNHIGGSQKKAKLYDCSNGLSLLGDISCISSSMDVTHMQFTRDSYYLFILAENQILIWNTEGNSPAITLQTQGIEAMLLYNQPSNSDQSDSPRVLLGCRGRAGGDTLEIYILSKDVEQLVSTDNTTLWPKKWKAPKLTADDKFLIMNLSSGFLILDATDLKQLTQISFHDDQIFDLSLSFDGRFAIIVTTAGNVKLFDFNYGTTLDVLQERIGSVPIALCVQESPSLFMLTGDKQVTSVHIPVLEQSPFNQGGPYYIRNTSYDNWLQMIPFWQLLNIKKYTCGIRNLTIDPPGLNPLHLLIDEDCPVPIEAALRDKCPIKKSAFGSPLRLAAELKKSKALQTLLKHLCSLAIPEQMQEFKIAVMESEDALVHLLALGGKHTGKFISCLFRPVCQEAELVSTPLGSTPLYRQEPDYWIRFSNFLSPTKDILTQLEFHISTLPLPLELGSRDSIDFLRSVRDTTANDVFNTKLLQSIIKYKWNKLWFYVMATTLLYWVMMGLLVSMIFGSETWTIRLVFGIVNGLMLVYETMQLCGDRSAYVSDPWNFVDLVRGCFAIAWAVRHMSDILTWILVFLCTIRGFSSFRAFDSTRYYIRIIIDVTRETFPFIIVFLYSVSTFGLLYAVSSREDVDTLDSSFWLSYSVIMGNDGYQDNPLEMTCYFLATLINVVLMMNLLVAVLSEAFERLRSRAIEGDLLEQVVVVLEFEELMIWNRDNNKKSFFISCEEREELLEDVQIRKIKRLRKELQITQQQLAEMKTEAAMQQEDLKSHISAVTSKLAEKFTDQLDELRNNSLANSQTGRR